jgi:hypothetical protein
MEVTSIRINVHNLAQVANWRSLVKTSLELQLCPLFQIIDLTKIHRSVTFGQSVYQESIAYSKEAFKLFINPQTKSIFLQKCYCAFIRQWRQLQQFLLLSWVWVWIWLTRYCMTMTFQIPRDSMENTGIIYWMYERIVLCSYMKIVCYVLMRVCVQWFFSVVMKK